jgi:putative transposase
MPTNNTLKYNRRSIRLKDFDYSQAGAYFVTLCTQNRDMLFGEIENGKMISNQLGNIVIESWGWLFKQYNYIVEDYSVVMPNHFHGLIIIQDKLGDSRTAPTNAPMKRKSLGRLIGVFKTASTKQMNKIRKLPESVLWQRNYYEHIIRNENELNTIRKNIIENPIRWEYDAENPERKNDPNIDKLPWADDNIP